MSYSSMMSMAKAVLQVVENQLSTVKVQRKIVWLKNGTLHSSASQRGSLKILKYMYQ